MFATVSPSVTAASLIAMAASRGLRIKSRPYINKGVRTQLTISQVTPVEPVHPISYDTNALFDADWDLDTPIMEPKIIPETLWEQYAREYEESESQSGVMESQYPHIYS